MFKLIQASDYIRTILNHVSFLDRTNMSAPSLDFPAVIAINTSPVWGVYCRSYRYHHETRLARNYLIPVRSIFFNA